MDRCFPKKAPLEKSVSDSQLFRKKEDPNHSWLTRQYSSTPEKRPTDFSEHKDEAETSHCKTTEHDIPQWRIGLKDVSSPDQTQEIDFSEHKDEAKTSYCKATEYGILQWRIELKDVSLPDEVKELVSKINDTLQKLRKEIKMSKLSQKVPQENIENILSDIYESLKKLTYGSESKKDEERPLTEDLNHYLGYIQFITNVVSNIRTGPNIIQEALTTGKFPKTLKRIIKEDIKSKIKDIRFVGANAKWGKWESLYNYIEHIKTLLNLLNDKQKNLEKPFETENSPAGPQENHEPHHLKLWLEKLAPNIQESDEWKQLSKE